MKKELINAWSAGLFEGEGTFQISNGVSKGVAITSTDKDVLQRFNDNYGGKIYQPTKRKEHWKDSFIWVVTGKDAVEFVKKIQPFLLGRRLERSNQWIQKRPVVKKINKKQVINLLNKGKTHAQIGTIIGKERSTVTKFISNMGEVR